MQQKWPILFICFPTIFGLRSPVIQKTLHTKTARYLYRSMRRFANLLIVLWCRDSFWPGESGFDIVHLRLLVPDTKKTCDVLFIRLPYSIPFTSFCAICL